MSSSSSFHNLSGGSKSTNDNALTAEQYSTFCQAKAAYDAIRAVQHLTQSERSSVLAFAAQQGVHHGSHLSSPMVTNTLGHLHSEASASANALEGVIACVSGIAELDKMGIKAVIESMGGTFINDVFGADMHQTHLIIPAEYTPNSARFKFVQEKRNGGAKDQAEKHWSLNLKIVTPDWVEQSLLNKKHVDETPYLILPQPVTKAVSSNPTPTIPPNASTTSNLYQTSSPPPQTTMTDSPIDKFAQDFPQQYPNGDVTILVKKVDGADDKFPVIGWAKQASHGVSKCLGVWTCPQYPQCRFRIRPKVPRRGKKPTQGIPPPTERCSVHTDVELVLRSCKCKWTILTNQDDQSFWEVKHNGDHDHPVPPPVQASHDAKKKLAQIISHNPDALGCQLTAGISSGKTNTQASVQNLDPKFSPTGYVSNLRRDTLKDIRKEVTGSEYDGEGMDGAFHFMEKVEERHPGFLLNSSLGPTQFITYASPQMKELLKRPVSGFETDTVEGMVDSIFFQGEINVTITSTWCDILRTQVPALISVLFRKSAQSYGIHWIHFFQLFGENKSTLEEFYEEFPGNTSDFSEAIKSAFMLSVDAYCQEHFNQMLTAEQKTDMYRYCSVHYKRNVRRVSHVSAVVPPSQRHDFINMAFSLLDIEDIGEFESVVLEMTQRFPALTAWFKWYLQDSRASILFPAVRSMSGADMERFHFMKKDTNAQEGLGGFLQRLKNNHKYGLQVVLETIEMFINQYDHQRTLAKDGMKMKYYRASPKQKRNGTEKKRHYKAPETGAELLSQRRGRKKQKITTGNNEIGGTNVDNDGTINVLDFHTHDGAIIETSQAVAALPVQLENTTGNICFMSALCQNLYANNTFRNALLATKLPDDGDEDGDEDWREQPIVILKSFMEKLSAMSHQCVNVVDPEEFRDILWKMDRDGIFDYRYSDQLQPTQMLQYILSVMKTSPQLVHHPLQVVCSLGNLTDVYRCRSCNGENVLVGPSSTKVVGDDGIELSPRSGNEVHVEVQQRVAGTSLHSCLRSKLTTETELDMFPSFAMKEVCCACDENSAQPVVHLSFGRWIFGSDSLMLVLKVARYESVESEQPLPYYARDAYTDQDCIKPELLMDLTPFFALSDEDKAAGVKINGHLTGYISFIQDSVYSPREEIKGRFISVTKSLTGNDFFLSDGLVPLLGPTNLGHIPTNDWPRPNTLFFDVRWTSGDNDDEPSAIHVDDVLDDTQSSSIPVTNSISVRDMLLSDTVQQKSEKELEAMLKPLTEAEEMRVNDALIGDGPAGEILVSHNGDDVDRASMQRLLPGEWLNDGLINCYIKQCLRKRDDVLCEQQQGRKPSHFFLSFFIQSLLDEKNSDPNLQGKYNYSNVVRWSKKVKGRDIFGLKYLYIPRNVGNEHWVSIFIFVEWKTVLFYDPMGGHDPGLLKVILRYLKDEWKQTHPNDFMDWNEWQLLHSSVVGDFPEQKNGYDCGAFACMFADFMSNDCMPVFHQSHMPSLRRYITLSILQGYAGRSIVASGPVALSIIRRFTARTIQVIDNDHETSSTDWRNNDDEVGDDIDNDDNNDNCSSTSDSDSNSDESLFTQQIVEMGTDMNDQGELIYSLHVGDVIRYRKPTVGFIGGDQVESKVIEIAVETPSGEEEEQSVTVTTSSIGNIFSLDHNPWFCIVRSNFDDAPPRKKWIHLKRVKWIAGKLEMREEEKEEARNEFVGNNQGAAQLAALSIATQAVRGERNMVEEKEAVTTEAVSTEGDWRERLKSIRVGAVGAREDSMKCQWKGGSCSRRANRRCSFSCCKTHCQLSSNGECKERSHRK